MAAELNPGDLLDHFLKCSHSARHRNECIRHLEHLALSFMHVAGNDQVVSPPHCMFARDQKLGNDSCHGAAVIKNRLGDGTHYADGATTENQPDAIFRQDRTEGAGTFDEGWIGTRSRPAIDANFSDFAAFFDLVHGYGYVRCSCGIVKATYQNSMTAPRLSAERVPTGQNPPI